MNDSHLPPAPPPRRPSPRRRTPRPLPPAAPGATAYPAGSPRAAGRSPRAPSSRASAIRQCRFGVGYAVGDDGSANTATTQTGSDWDRGQPGDGHGPMGDLEGQVPGGGMGGPPGDPTQGEGGTTDQAPDFDGDGRPDTDSGSSSGSTTDSAALNG